jgi:hypothetical protein
MVEAGFLDVLRGESVAFRYYLIDGQQRSVAEVTENAILQVVATAYPFVEILC